LKDDREIWIGDGRVHDVVSHPDFAGAANGLAAVFDLQYQAATTACFPIRKPARKSTSAT